MLCLLLEEMHATERWENRPAEGWDASRLDHREMGRDETFYSIDKARELLGYEPQHSWRDVLPDPGKA